MIPLLLLRIVSHIENHVVWSCRHFQKKKKKFNSLEPGKNAQNMSYPRINNLDGNVCMPRVYTNIYYMLMIYATLFEWNIVRLLYVLETVKDINCRQAKHTEAYTHDKHVDDKAPMKLHSKKCRHYKIHCVHLPL